MEEKCEVCEKINRMIFNTCFDCIHYDRDRFLCRFRIEKPMEDINCRDFLDYENAIKMLKEDGRL